MKKSEKKSLKEQLEIESEYRKPSSEEQFDRDFDAMQNKRYPSEDTPADIFQYKTLRLIPNSETDFKGMIDKDVVLANVRKNLPDPVYNKLVVETIAMFKKVFVIEQDVMIADANGEPIKDKNGEPMIVRRKVFDQEFDSVIEFLSSGFKYEHVASRAMGDDREAILDRSNILQKETRKTENQNKYMN